MTAPVEAGRRGSGQARNSPGLALESWQNLTQAGLPGAKWKLIGRSNHRPEQLGEYANGACPPQPCSLQLPSGR